jgi:hypothetical protein
LGKLPDEAVSSAKPPQAIPVSAVPPQAIPVSAVPASRHWHGTWYWLTLIAIATALVTIFVTAILWFSRQTSQPWAFVTTAVYAVLVLAILAVLFIAALMVLKYTQGKKPLKYTQGKKPLHRSDWWNLAGRFALGAGLAGLLGFYLMDTTVPVPRSPFDGWIDPALPTRVHNVGLMHQRLTGLIVSGMAALGGTMILLFVSLSGPWAKTAK